MQRFIISEADNDEASTTDDENVINKSRKRKRVRIISDYDEESENISKEIETAAHGTVCLKFDEGDIS